jgi:hypothetical protein
MPPSSDVPMRPVTSFIMVESLSLPSVSVSRIGSEERFEEATWGINALSVVRMAEHATPGRKSPLSR